MAKQYIVVTQGNCDHKLTTYEVLFVCKANTNYCYKKLFFNTISYTSTHIGLRFLAE